jgi:flagellar hook-associated protein 2
MQPGVDSMTTTTSTTSTAATTSTASAASAITTALGAGSGIDIASLVSSLVTNQFSVEKAALAAKAETLTTQISTVGTLQSGITSFSSALASLISGGTLATQPTSSNTAVLSVTALPGAKLAKLSASVQVQQLASAQAATTKATGQAATDVIGTGTLTLNFGTATVDSSGAMTGFTAGSGAPVAITIDSSNNTMAGIASAINAANAGVTATVVSDVNGARLTIKSATGQAQAFTLSATEGDTAGLSALNVGVGATGTSIGTAAKDAIVSLDGVQLQRSTNSISDLVTGVKLDLVSVSSTAVTLGATRPTSSITQAVDDFISTYNSYFASVKEATDPTSGTLKQDSATKTLQSGLQALTLVQLTTSSASGAPLTLAAIGIGTARDGTLSVDSAKLTQAMTNFPDEVEAMFAAASGTSATNNGLAGALAAIATKATSAAFGLAASTLKYNAAKTTVTDDQAQEVTDEADATTRLTAQYSAMDTRVTAYKAVQSFLDQQIAAWNKSS